MINLLGLNKYIVYIIGVVAIVGVLATTYYVWKHGIEQAALLDFNRQQLEQTVKDQAEFLRRQEEIDYQQRRASHELASQNRRLQTRIDSVNQMINQAEDSTVPDIIKQTIDRLREESSR